MMRVLLIGGCGVFLGAVLMLGAVYWALHTVTAGGL